MQDVIDELAQGVQLAHDRWVLRMRQLPTPSSRSAAIQAALATLAQRQTELQRLRLEMIVVMREDGQSLPDIAGVLGVTKSRAQQLVAAADRSAASAPHADTDQDSISDCWRRGDTSRQGGQA